MDDLTFGNGIRLNVLPSESSPSKPNLAVLSPLLPRNWVGDPKDLPPEVCLATNFRPRQGQMVLNVNNGPDFVNTSSAVLSKKQKSYVFAGFSNRTIYSCELHDSVSNNEQIDLCDDIYPGKARLNFLLLLMNGARLVFTKTLAFNTVLTIRAMMFYPLSPGPDVCLATDFRPKLGKMVLSINNGPAVILSTESAVLSSRSKSYFFAGFTNEKIDSCRLNNTEEKTGEKNQPVPCPTVEPTQPEPNATDTEPDHNAERSRLNFFLLLMNGVRLVFTKTLAFNTILTIRAVMF
ncbi:uncharacterized protein LOC114844776 [Betta splendens]|uniref:Uncharacterized protein LOC114844776 n=1 Tax=Betta splendens TaxID=158456 RepID=A0A6P7L0P4_BETSP|nr:uncharacterized protein LOC114844776 [Betta splendens]